MIYFTVQINSLKVRTVIIANKSAVKDRRLVQTYRQNEQTTYFLTSRFKFL